MGREELSDAIQARIDVELDGVRRAVAGRPTPRVLFVLGTEHPSTIGSGWLTDELLTIAGGKNAASELGLTSWANINLETVLTLQPDVLICKSAAGEQAIKQARAYWERLTDLKAVKNGRVHVTDDRRLTIPGSRVGRTARKLAEMIHHEAFASTPEGDEHD